MNKPKSLQNLCDWVSKITQQANFLLIPFTDNAIISVKNNIIYLSNAIQKSDPYFSNELFKIKDSLFRFYKLDAIELGRLIEILNYLWSKQSNSIDDIWNMIHPKIGTVSKQLYMDGHYANAAEDAFIEINDRVKKLFRKLDSTRPIPDGRDVMNKVFADGNKAMIEVCDRSTEIGANIHEGTRFMLVGAMAALRNPKAHTNTVIITQQECIRRLMFASMLMYKIDEAVAYSKITE